MDSYILLNRLKEGTFEYIERITYGFSEEWIQRVVLECSPHARCAALIVIDAFEQYCNHHSLPPEKRTLQARAFSWVLGRAAANVFDENYSPSELRAAINGEPLEPHEATPTPATTPPPPAEPQHKKPSGRKQNEIDKPEKMEAKAAELKAKWKDEKGDQPLVITETSVDNEANQFIIDFMADWASERIFLQKSKTAPAPAVRFLRDYCKIPIEGIEWRTWQTHTAKMIPQIYEEKKRKKE